MLKRIAFTDISHELIEQWLKNPIRHHDVIWQTNLPKDAKIVRCTESSNGHNLLRVYWESVEFDLVSDGILYPEFSLTATTSLFFQSKGSSK